MNRDRVCGAVALIVAAAFVGGGAEAEEMTVAPAAIITAPANIREWTGFYIGGNGGYGEASSFASYNPDDPAARGGTCGGVGGGKCIPQADYYTRGPMAGGQIGYNWQINPLWLVGAEADYQWANLVGQGVSSFRFGNSGGTAANSSMTLNQTVSSFGTARARLGVVPASPVLLYGTAGLAFGKIGENLSLQSASAATVSTGGFSYNCAANAGCFAGSSSQTRVGWTVGGGIEFALTTNLIIRSEVLYVNLGVPKATAVAQTPMPGTSASSFSTSLSPLGFVVARGGMSFKF